MALERVVDPLQLEVRERFDALGDRAAERAQRREHVPVELGLAGPHEADAGHRPAVPLGWKDRGLRLADPGGERGRARGDRVQVAPATQRRGRVLDREEELDDMGLAGHRVQPELELGDDAEVAAAAAEPPEQVRVLGLVDMQPAAVGGDQLERLHVVAREPEPAREPAHATAERQPADAGVGDVARGRGQPVLHRGAIERAEQRPALHPRTPALGIDADAAHRREVDHQAALRNAQPEHAVPSAAHADLEIALAAEMDRLGDLVRVRAAHDRPRPAVDHRVPHRPGLVVTRGAVLQEPAVRRRTHHRAGFCGPRARRSSEAAPSPQVRVPVPPRRTSPLRPLDRPDRVASPGVPSVEASTRVRARLRELFERHRDADAARVDRFYDSERGYYPPEEAGEERDHFAICLASVDGKLFCEGDHDRPFALQSISKVFAYALALADNRREDVLARVGVEPSGDAFNSIVFDERYHRPYNPMVNAGALVTTDLVRGASGERKLERLLGVMQACAGDTGLAVNERTFARELRHADRNRATAYLMRAEGMLDGDVEELLALYLHQCSVQVTCAQLAVMGATLANGALNPFTGERALPRDRVRDLLSVMYTCGMYDAAGQWAYEVGVPAKSGVSGGILAVVPGKGGIGVFSPGLDVYGNSVRGMGVCYDIATQLGVHVFAADDEDALLGPGTPTPH